MKGLISVIVPVYNAEKYLARCIDSILGQTHTDLELILVDDGSRDSSGAVCDEYAARDPRVRVIHKANGGVSAARNDGIESARGEFISFCDNDDFYAPGMLERLLAMCVENDCDIAQCACQRGGADNLPTPPPQPVQVMTGREMLESFYTAGSVWIWDKLYRRKVWVHVRFPVGSHMYEDNIIIHRLYGAARRIAVTRERLYYYFRNPESVTGQRFNVLWTSIDPYADRLVYARDENLPRLYEGTMTKRVYNEGCWLVMNRRYGRGQSSSLELPSREEENERSDVNRRHNRDADSRREFHTKHRALFRTYYREAMATPGVSVKNKILMSALRFTPLIYHLYNWLKWRVVRGERNVRFGEIK